MHSERSGSFLWFSVGALAFVASSYLLHGVLLAISVFGASVWDLLRIGSAFFVLSGAWWALYILILLFLLSLILPWFIVGRSFARSIRSLVFYLSFLHSVVCRL